METLLPLLEQAGPPDAPAARSPRRGPRPSPNAARRTICVRLYAEDLRILERLGIGDRTWSDVIRDLLRAAPPP